MREEGRRIGEGRRQGKMWLVVVGTVVCVVCKVL